jgi:hypothetical protein
MLSVATRTGRIISKCYWIKTVTCTGHLLDYYTNKIWSNLGWVLIDEDSLRSAPSPQYANVQGPGRAP